MTQIFLFTSSTGGGTGSFFPDPGNWNVVHKVECVAAGNYGSGGTLTVAGGGGAGGSYAIGENLNLTFPVPYLVTNFNANQGHATKFNSGVSGHITDPNVVSAPVGYPGTAAGSGGATWLAPPHPTGHNGGRGGTGGATTIFQSGGGGGAAGPNGPGSDGQDATPTSFGAGGEADAGTVPGPTGAGQTGLSGTQWGIFGVGSGGAGSPAANTVTGRGGSFGGGGAGGYRTNVAGGPGYLRGTPGDGLIVIHYKPLKPSGVMAMIMA